MNLSPPIHVTETLATIPQWGEKWTRNKKTSYVDWSSRFYP